MVLTLVPQTLSQHNRQEPVFKNLRFDVFADTLHRVWTKRCLARTTPKRLFKFSTAGGVNECCLARYLLRIFLTPSHESNKRWRQRQASFGQSILISDRLILIFHSFENAKFHQPPKSLGQHGTGNSKVITKIIETTDAPQPSSNQQDRPAIANDAKGLFDR